MAFSLQPPPVTSDVDTLRAWCETLYEWLKVPERPCFLVQPASDQTNIAIDGWVTVVFGTEYFDINSNFASNTFTAPITGKYLLSTVVRLAQTDTDADYYWLRINTSNRTYTGPMLDPDEYTSDLEYFGFSMSVVADMDAGDTATVAVYQSGGAAQTDIRSNATWFSGVLVAR